MALYLYKKSESFVPHISDSNRFFRSVKVLMRCRKKFLTYRIVDQLSGNSTLVKTFFGGSGFGCKCCYQIQPYHTYLKISPLGTALGFLSYQQALCVTVVLP